MTQQNIKDHRNKKPESKIKTKIYHPDEEVLVRTSGAGIFLKEVKVGKFFFQASGKAVAVGDTIGFVKLIFDKKYS